MSRLVKYSRILPGEERIRVCALHGNTIIDTLPGSGTSTLFELLQRGACLWPNNEYLGGCENGEYKWLTYKEVAGEVYLVAKGIRELGVQPGGDSRVGIAGLNSVRFMIVQHALTYFSIVHVPLYHNYTMDNLCEIMNNCELDVIFCDTLNRAETFIDKVNFGSIKSLKMIIVMERNFVKYTNSERNSGIKVFSWNEILELGRTSSFKAIPPKPDDVSAIYHTSGTTGTSKGVQVTHRGLLASVASLNLTVNKDLQVGREDRYLTYLPPAHIYEQVLEAFMLYSGGSIAVFRGNIKKISEDMQLVQPTIVALVPRLLKAFHDQIYEQVKQQSHIKQLFFNLAVKKKLGYLMNGNHYYRTIWDKLVFKNIWHKFGGRLRLITSGGAPLSAAVKNFSKIAYGCPLIEGYGQTECSGVLTASTLIDNDSDNVGGPATWAQVKVVDVDELNYSAENDVGEVCFRGAGIMKGYYKDETLEKIDSEGWLHTGDIGRWLSNGALQIIDRTNSVIKMAQGDFISPERVESIYAHHPLVTQIFVHGSPLQQFLVAIVVVDEKNIREFCAGRKHPELNIIGDLELAQLLADRKLKNCFIRDLREHGTANGLSGIEQIRNLHLTNEDFALNQSVTTPTLKIKRKNLYASMARHIDPLFDEDIVAK